MSPQPFLVFFPIEKSLLQMWQHGHFSMTFEPTHHFFWPFGRLPSGIHTQFSHLVEHSVVPQEGLGMVCVTLGNKPSAATILGYKK